MASEPNKSSLDTNKEKKSLLPIILIILLLLGNAFLLFFNWKTVNEKEQLTVRVDSLDKLKIQLEQQISIKIQELEAMKGENTELNARIDSMLTTLNQQKEQISKLIWYKGEYFKKKALVDGLERSVDNYIAQIDALKKAHALEVDSLNQTINNEREEKANLEETNKVLADKVAMGSMLKANNVTGAAISSKGKETSKAKKAVKITVSFTLAENKMADPGNKELLLRIIAPGGATLAVDNKGSGTFMPKGLEKEEKYSLKQSFNYKNTDMSGSMTWEQENEFASGNYKFEIYYDNSIIGTGTMFLK